MFPAVGRVFNAVVLAAVILAAGILAQSATESLRSSNARRGGSPLPNAYAGSTAVLAATPGQPNAAPAIGGGIANYPAAGWPQWTSASVMTQRLDGRNPAAHIASWSASVISYYNSSGQGMGKWDSYDPLHIGQGSDAGTPVYVAVNTDPTITIHCSEYTCSSLEGRAIHIPSNAVVEEDTAFGGDQHMLVISPDGRYTYEMYHAKAIEDYFAKGGTGGATIDVGSGQRFDTGGTAWSQSWSGPEGGATDEAYVSIVAGDVTAEDLLQNSINHAMLIGAPCETGYVYPTIYSGPLDGPCRGGTGAPLGARLWLNMTDAEIDAISDPNVDALKKVVAKGLHHYGAFLHDSVGHPVWFLRRSSAARPPSSTNWQRAAALYAMPIDGSRSWIISGWPESIASRFVWLDPCVSRSSC